MPGNMMSLILLRGQRARNHLVDMKICPCLRVAYVVSNEVYCKIIIMSKVVILIYLRSFSSESESNDGPSEVALTLAHLQSLHHCTESQDTSSYADNGTDPKRLKELLKEPPCNNCQIPCRVPLKVLVATCRAFWGLAKEMQDSLLWSLQCSNGRKTKWSIEGRIVFP